jgi:hypothetical protein
MRFRWARQLARVGRRQKDTTSTTSTPAPIPVVVEQGPTTTFITIMSSIGEFMDHQRKINEELNEVDEDGEGDGSSSSSSSDSVFSSTEHTGKFSDYSTASSLSLVKAETRMVRRIKVLVLLVIAIAAATCGALTFVFVKQSELHEFEVQVRMCFVHVYYVVRAKASTR